MLLTGLLILVICSYLTVTVPAAAVLCCCESNNSKIGDGEDGGSSSGGKRCQCRSPLTMASRTVVSKAGAVFQIAMWLFAYLVFIQLN
jgi:hypothetical protein